MTHQTTEPASELEYLRRRNDELEQLLKQATPYVDAACGVLILIEQHKEMLSTRSRINQLAKELKWES